MKRIFSLASIAIATAVFLTACSKKDSPPPVVDDNSTVTSVGNPTGILRSKNINETGGQLSSADGTVQIIVPAGAVEQATEFSIQPISNELTGEEGTAFRLLPHGFEFKKPVTIVFQYRDEDLQNTIPEFIDIAYQDAEGSWQAITTSILDKQAHKISVTSTHFSDWSYFKSLNLNPAEATVELGGSVDLKVTTRFPYLDPDDAPSGQPTIKILKNPRDLRPDEIKNWSYSGNGILISRGAEAFYTAPDEEPDTNPEAVVANVNMHRKGQFMLVSNITVLAGHNVAYLKVDEDYKSPLNNGNCMMYMYGNFGNDPGENKRLIKINGTTVPADIWTPTFIRCQIDREISGPIEIIANNNTLARSVLRKYTGSFIYKRFQGGNANAGSTNPLKEEIEFKIVYRGFGAPCPAEVDQIFEFDGLPAFGTRADYKLGGSASVTTPGPCPTTTSVSLTETSGTLLLNTIAGSPFTEFMAEVHDIAGGISIKIDFNVMDVITGVLVNRTNCNGSSVDPPKTLIVSLEGFSNTAINLAFDGPEQLKLKGTDQLKSGALSSSILIEAWDGTGSPSHYETDGLVPATFSNKH